MRAMGSVKPAGSCGDLSSARGGARMACQIFVHQPPKVLANERSQLISGYGRDRRLCRLTRNARCFNCLNAAASFLMRVSTQMYLHQSRPS